MSQHTDFSVDAHITSLYLDRFSNSDWLNVHVLQAVDFAVDFAHVPGQVLQWLHQVRGSEILGRLKRIEAPLGHVLR